MHRYQLKIHNQKDNHMACLVIWIWSHLNLFFIPSPNYQLNRHTIGSQHNFNLNLIHSLFSRFIHLNTSYQLA